VGHAEDTLGFTIEAARTLNLRARMDLPLARELWRASGFSATAIPFVEGERPAPRSL
jgi:hypothetical protein